jgi:hypothetical protein
MNNKPLINEILKIRYYTNYGRGKVISEQEFPMGGVNYDSKEAEKKEKEKEENKKNAYPNYCKYYDKAIYPKINGISKEESLIDGYCNYPSPSRTQIGGTVSLYVPKDMGLSFWKTDDDYIKFAKEIQEQYPDIGEKNLLVQNLKNILPKGTIRQLHGSDYYVTQLSYDNSTNMWLFNGFIGGKTKKFFPQPKWVDKRTPYEKFIDENGLMLQLGAAAGTIIITLATGGIAGPLLVFSEILVEGGIGILVAKREWDKGENVTAAFSLLTALLPILKYSKNVSIIRGVSSDELSRLSEIMTESKLNTKSTKTEFEAFMNGLNDNDKKLLLKVLDYDEVSAKQLVDFLTKNVDEFTSEILISEMKQVLKENPDILKSLSFFEKLWARELTANVLVTIVGAVINVTLGKVLNNKDKEILKGYYNIVPDSLKKEAAYNILKNAENIEEILPYLEKISKIVIDLSPEKMKSVSEYINSKTKETFDKKGLKYEEMENDPTTATSNLKSNEEREKQLRSMGFVPKSEAKPDCGLLDSTVLNGVEWFLC